MHTTTVRRVGAAAALSLLLAGCGLKQDTYQTLKQSGGGVALGGGNGANGGGNPNGVVDPNTGQVVDPNTGQVIDPNTGQVVPGTGSNNGTGNVPGGGGGATTPPGGGGGPTPTNAPPGPGGPGTSTGVTKDTIRIAIHAPITGAAPLPAGAFETGAKMWWANHKVFGRQVQVDVLNDEYKPSSARRVCETASQDHFIVIGAAGTDQIQACASDPVLARTHTPYLSAGVTENGLAGLSNYFAVSLSYKQQASAVLKNAKAYGSSGKWAVVTTDTPNFYDARDGIVGQLNAAHIENRVFKSPKTCNDDPSASVSLAQELINYRADTVYFLTAPKCWLYVIQQTHQQLYEPIWTGPGVSMGENEVAGVACKQDPQLKATFLSPYPGTDQAPSDFKSAPGHSSTPNDEDIQLSLYGLSQVIYQALLATGGNLTREAFMAKLPSLTIQSNVYPTVAFKGGHFGGTQAWPLKVDCNSQTWKTAGPKITP
jgi:ABC-type branched-subunit amino acid transport system substrate-binding protein